MEMVRTKVLLAKGVQDRLNSQLCRAHSNEDTSGKNGVYEPGGISHRQIAVSDRRDNTIREVGSRMDWRNLVRSCEPLGEAWGRGEHILKESVHGSPAFFHDPSMYDTANAISAVGKRNPPYPAVPHDVDANIALGNRRITSGSLKMREDRHFAEIWQRFALTQSAAEQGG